MDLLSAFGVEVNQQDFGDLVGVSQQRVSELLHAGVLRRGDTALQWLHAYRRHLEEQAAARMAAGGCDLVLERALLARAQREAQEIRNAKMWAEYAPRELLASVLQRVSEEVAAQLDQLEGEVRRACPDLPAPARQVVRDVAGSAAAEWLRATAELKDSAVVTMEDDPADETLAEEDEATPELAQ